LVTGATGGLGAALLARLAGRGLGVSRRPGPGLLAAERIEDLAASLGDQSIGDIVHCAWPRPDNESLLELDQPSASIERHVAQPLRDVLALARLLAERGKPTAMLLLVGSTFAEPGRHAYRMPLYTVAKSMIPTLARILALELAAGGRRAAAVVFDVVDGGMNKALSPAIRQAHADRTLSGRLPSPDEAAAQIVWMLENRNHLLSGATVTLSGGALP
jgi:NAD(P)-dependent dehydrogenase (short-subunit alcohol dehydrogenase family)